MVVYFPHQEVALRKLYHTVIKAHMNPTRQSQSHMSHTKSTHITERLFAEKRK